MARSTDFKLPVFDPPQGFEGFIKFPDLAVSGAIRKMKYVAG
jgi:hypothetical protein